MKPELTRRSWMLILLTFTTGVVDAVSFLGLGHVFVANMTGNVAFLGFALAGGSDVDAPGSLVSLAFFLVGGAWGGRLARKLASGPPRIWLGRVAGLEVACFLLSGIAASIWDQESRLLLLALGAVAMGLRNATVMKLGDPDFKTTVLTLTITGLAMNSRFAGGEDPRWARRLVAVFALFAGGAVGTALLLGFGLAVPLFFMAAGVAGATALYVAHPSSAEAPANR